MGEGKKNDRNEIEIASPSLLHPDGTLRRSRVQNLKRESRKVQRKKRKATGPTDHDPARPPTVVDTPVPYPKIRTVERKKELRKEREKKKRNFQSAKRSCALGSTQNERLKKHSQK